MNRFAIALGGLLIASAALAQSVDVNITADNAYKFGYGTVAAMTSILGSAENTTAGAIFNCPPSGLETYLNVPAITNGYLYIIGYSDDSASQGVLAQFVSGS